ncbi:LysM domain-containing protein [Tissierella sp.]|uniref:LysM domain-containing protein n=1 Tax=Tissierella sp. TaxID=41274 RepID=UPI002859CAA1|nr:LysM domain-containing protein [Tissierella sp.]MDR7856127.1 LysM domain-containing protein [Tissierella sp.]
MEKSLLKKKKNKSLEFTRNEKVLLYLLAIILFSWLVYKFIINPQSEKLRALAIQKTEYLQKIGEINDILRREDQINKDWDVLHIGNKKIVSKYFPKLDQAQIIYLLNGLIENENLSVADLNFNRPVYEDIGDLQVKNMDISIPYSGSYFGVLDMINAIKSSPRKILVDSMSMDMDTDGKLNGIMTLKVYSLDGIAEADSNIIYIDIAKEEDKNTPFIPYEDYKSSETNIVEEIEKVVVVKPYVEETLLDFENKNFYFLPSQEFVKGYVSQSTKAKSKDYSLRLEYDIVAIEEENRGYIDISKNNIQLKYPPNTVGLWIYSYDYSPATVGIAFRGQMGEDICIPLTEGIGWTGWKYVEANPPDDLIIYPLNLEKLYVEIPKNRDNCGVILIDKLEAVYSRNIDENGKDVSIGDCMFHVVNSGDTAEKISMEYYGSKKYVNEILKLNEISGLDIIPVGKVLVLKKR